MTQHSKFSEAASLYESNKAIMKLVADGFLLKREDHINNSLGERSSCCVMYDSNKNGAGASFLPPPSTFERKLLMLINQD